MASRAGPLRTERPVGPGHGCGFLLRSCLPTPARPLHGHCVQCKRTVQVNACIEKVIFEQPNATYLDFKLQSTCRRLLAVL